MPRHPLPVCMVAWLLIAAGATHCQPTQPTIQADTLPPTVASTAPSLARPPASPGSGAQVPPASSVPPAPSSSYRAMPGRPACERIELGMCTGASRWLAGCDGGGLSTPSTKHLVADLIPPLRECLAATSAGDSGCAAVLRGCVHDTVMTRAQPTADDETRCDQLLRSCAQASHKANYTREQCAHVLAASTPGPSRAQVEQALGPASQEPRPCAIDYIWPPLPFTPYFP